MWQQQLWLAFGIVALIGAAMGWIAARRYQNALAASGQNGLLWMRAQCRLQRAMAQSMKAVALVLIGIAALFGWPEQIEARRAVFTVSFFAIAVGINATIALDHREHMLARRYMEAKWRREDEAARRGGRRKDDPPMAMEGEG